MRDGLSRLVVRAVEAPIRLYRRLISPLLPPRCKYEPSCSAYALEAVRTYGVLRGVVLAGWRVLRCNPFSHGGYDPPQAQRLFSGKAVLARERALQRPQGAARPPSRSEA